MLNCASLSAVFVISFFDAFISPSEVFFCSLTWQKRLWSLDYYRFWLILLKAFYSNPIFFTQTSEKRQALLLNIPENRDNAGVLWMQVERGRWLIFKGAAEENQPFAVVTLRPLSNVDPVWTINSHPVCVWEKHTHTPLDVHTSSQSVCLLRLHRKEN